MSRISEGFRVTARCTWQLRSKIGIRQGVSRQQAVKGRVLAFGAMGRSRFPNIQLAKLISLTSPNNKKTSVLTRYSKINGSGMIISLPLSWDPIINSLRDLTKLPIGHTQPPKARGHRTMMSSSTGDAEEGQWTFWEARVGKVLGRGFSK